MLPIQIRPSSSVVAQVIEQQTTVRDSGGRSGAWEEQVEELDAGGGGLTSSMSSERTRRRDRSADFQCGDFTLHDSGSTPTDNTPRTWTAECRTRAI